MNYQKVKYYPDRFYANLDNFDFKHLHDAPNGSLSEEQCLYIHEYYHFLTNLTTFAGLRQFNINFQDRFRIIRNIAFLRKGKAFPMNSNAFKDCEYLINYWKDISAVLDEDDINMNLVEIIEKSSITDIQIKCISLEICHPMTIKIDNQIIRGARERVKLEIEPIKDIDNFYLSFGDIDEFLSATIDEFLFEHSLAPDSYRDVLNSRSYYPYRFLHTLLAYYNLQGLSTEQKICICYIALHSENPPVTLITLLNNIKSNSEQYIQGTGLTILNHFAGYIYIGKKYRMNLDYLGKFFNETIDYRSPIISYVMYTFEKRFRKAILLVEADPFIYIRPFLSSEYDNGVFDVNLFWEHFLEIEEKHGEPLICQNRRFVNESLSNPERTNTIFILAIYEIMLSLQKNHIPKRTKNNEEKYLFPPGVYNSFVITNHNYIPLDLWHTALNQMGLLKLYYDESNEHYFDKQ